MYQGQPAYPYAYGTSAASVYAPMPAAAAPAPAAPRGSSDLQLPAIPASFPQLDKLNTTELQQLLDDDAMFVEFFYKLPYVQELEAVKESLTEANAKAESECQQKATEAVALQSEVEALQAQVQELQASLEPLRQRQQAVQARNSPAALAARLRSLAQEADDAAAAVERDFRDGKMSIDAFERAYMESRTLYHTRCAKAERLEGTATPSRALPAVPVPAPAPAASVLPPLAGYPGYPPGAGSMYPAMPGAMPVGITQGLENCVVQAVGQQDLFFVTSGKRHLIADQVELLFHGFDKRPLHTVQPDVVAAIPRGVDYRNSVEGKLVRNERGDKVYLIENGKKREFENMDAFTKLGHKAGDIVVGAPYISLIPDGDRIVAPKAASRSWFGLGK